MSDDRHIMFQKFGHSHHMQISDAVDLRKVLVLDEAHWVATGAPISSMNFDPVLLDFLDTDNNGRVMCFEIKSAIKWTLEALENKAGINQGSSELLLDTITAESADGREIREALLKVLEQADMEADAAITLDQIRAIRSETEKTPVSEAGVVLPEAADDDEIKQFLTDIVETMGGIDHPSGSKGVNGELVKEFLVQAQARIDWHKKRVIPKGSKTTDIMPLGEETLSAYRLYAELAPKLEQYFAQCEAVEFDERIVEHVKPGDEDLKNADLRDPAAIQEFLKKASIASPRADGVLRFDQELNPFYEKKLLCLNKEVVSLALSRDSESLSREEWLSLVEIFAAHDKWVSSKEGGAVEKLGDRLEACLDNRFEKAVASLITESKKTALDLDQIRLIEKTILFQANLITIANNFVSFPYLYDPTIRAIFEMGTLIIDGRHLRFSVKVEDIATHSSVAKTSDMFVVYAEIRPTIDGNADNGPNYTVAVPVTSGNKGNLCIGKRGVFIDRNGVRSDAKIVQLIENPISIRETLVSPFKRISKTITGKIESMTTAAEKKLDSAASSITAPTSGAASSQQKGLMAGGLLMGGGVAIAALTAAAASVVKTVAGLGVAKTLGGILIAVVAVMAPATFLAILKLRRRDMSAILEGSGWAINARMRLTHRLGVFFTQRPRFPKGSRGIGHGASCTVALILLAMAALFAVSQLEKGKKSEVSQKESIKAKTPVVEAVLNTNAAPVGKLQMQ